MWQSENCYIIGVKSKNNLAYSNNNTVKWKYFLGPAVHKSQAHCHQILKGQQAMNEQVFYEFQLGSTLMSKLDYFISHEILNH